VPLGERPRDSCEKFEIASDSDATLLLLPREELIPVSQLPFVYTAKHSTVLANAVLTRPSIAITCLALVYRDVGMAVYSSAKSQAVSQSVMHELSLLAPAEGRARVSLTEYKKERLGGRKMCEHFQEAGKHVVRIRAVWCSLQLHKLLVHCEMA
jgi:hypothetical protein